MEPECKFLVIDIPEKVEPARWPGCSIYRVPKKLREVKKQAYTPKLVSIGPFHHRPKEFRDMEMQKLRYLKGFCSRTRRTPEDLATIIGKKKGDIVRYYSETFERIKDEHFIKMILLDAIFIIELFLRSSEPEKDHEMDYILSKPWLTIGVRQDLLLLENQLPFFVLKELYEKSFRDYSHSENRGEAEQKKPVTKSFLELAFFYFRLKDKKRLKEMSDPGKDVLHFTDLLRTCYCPDSKNGKWLESKDFNPENVNYGVETFLKRSSAYPYSATMLEDAGVVFEAFPKRSSSAPKKGKIAEGRSPESGCVDQKEEDIRSLLDIRFQKAAGCCALNCSCFLNCLPCLKHTRLKDKQPILTLPILEVNDTTECVFRNLMALEQCHYPSETYICNYVLLLDHLINTEKDVDLLVETGVICNLLGSNAAVAKLINRLGIEILESKSYYHGLSEQLNAHYESSWNRHMASLKSVYFRDFWRGTATAVGIIVLFVTVGNFLRPFILHAYSKRR